MQVVKNLPFQGILRIPINRAIRCRLFLDIHLADKTTNTLFDPLDESIVTYSQFHRPDIVS
jgi:hypothetical protein